MLRCPLGFLRAAGFLFLSTLALIASSEAAGGDMPVVRWTPNSTASTFSQTPDGKYVYGLAAKDLSISMAVDSQELEKVRHRPLPLFSIRLDAHYSGQKSVQLTMDHVVLEFVDHYQVTAPALDLDDLGTRIQTDIDNLTEQTEREVHKHPEQKQQLESLLQAHLKDMTDLVGFTSLYGLQDSTLSGANSSAGGWIFFNAKNKWIGQWKPQERFILRVPAGGAIFEFPFALPPQKGDLILRRREP